MHFDFTLNFSTVFSASTLLLVAKFYRAWIITQEQHGMMWRDYKKRHGINGHSILGINES